MADEIDLRDKLVFAAGSLAADFGGALSADRAEELIFNSADRLLAAASVTDFIPILAERDARRAVRGIAPIPRPDVQPPAPAVSAEPPSEPLLAVPDTQLARLQGDVERARQRLVEWQEDLTRR